VLRVGGAGGPRTCADGSLGPGELYLNYICNALSDRIQPEITVLLDAGLRTRQSVWVYREK
jgi:hypothetical protein